MPKVLFCGEDLSEVVRSLPSNKKQRSCKHSWDHVESARYRDYNTRQIRIFCTKCGVHFQKYEIKAWGPWESLPSIKIGHTIKELS